MRFAATTFLLVACLTACQSTEDYLADLDRLDPEPKTPSFEDSAVIFDEGQLGHEALTGLATADEMTLWQAVVSLSHATTHLLKARDNALLQADAAVLIGRLVTRIPVPPVTQEFALEEKTNDRSIELYIELVKARAVFGIPAAISALEGQDAVQKEEARDTLRELTDQDFGDDVTAWRTWWESVREERTQDFIEKSRGPLREFGRMRFRSAGDANAVFRALASYFSSYLDPRLAEESTPAVLRVARQAVVLGLIEALKSSEFGDARADVADTMALVRDPAFGVPLIERLQRERDQFTKAKIVRALAHYPRRQTIVAILNAMAISEPIVGIAGSDSLRAITGERFGEDLAAWEVWWKDTGSARWP
ncbi:MAG: hypothetical protein R3F20_15910 [Planctomycetota bacterium]